MTSDLYVSPLPAHQGGNPRLAALLRIELRLSGSEPDIPTMETGHQLERDIGFEPTRTTWKDVMLPATSIPHVGAAGEDRTHAFPPYQGGAFPLGHNGM